MSCFKVKVVTHFLKIFKIIQIIYERNDGANKMQIEQRWVFPQTIIRAKKKRTAKKQENLAIGKLRIRLNNDSERKRKTRGRMQ